MGSGHSNESLLGHIYWGLPTLLNLDIFLVLHTYRIICSLWSGCMLVVSRLIWRNTRKLSRKSKPNFNILQFNAFQMSWDSAVQQKSNTTLSSFLGLLVPLAGFFMSVSVPSIEIVVKTTVLSIVVKTTVVVSWDLEKLRSHMLF